jgi:hypothetical protein
MPWPAFRASPSVGWSRSARLHGEAVRDGYVNVSVAVSQFGDQSLPGGRVGSSVGGRSTLGSGFGGGVSCGRSAGTSGAVCGGTSDIAVM